MSPFTPWITESIRQWLELNEKSIKIIADKALNARRAREAARKARETVRNQNEKKQKALKFDSKLADCYSKKRNQCEIYITEGDSASGNLKMLVIMNFKQFYLSEVKFLILKSKP